MGGSGVVQDGLSRRNVHVHSSVHSDADPDLLNKVDTGYWKTSCSDGDL